MSDTYTEFGPLNINQQTASDIKQRGFGVVGSGATDDRLIVGFYRKSVLNQFKSREQGKRICEDHDYVKIQHPGEALNIVDRPVNDSDKYRWPRQWALFQQGKDQRPDGIPITLLFPANPAISDTLTGYNIHTVEQLAALSAHGIGTVGMGCQEWVNKAQKYLEQAQKGVDFHRFEQAIEQKDRQISTQARQIQELSEQVAKLSKIVEPAGNYDVQTSQINLTQQRQPIPQNVTFSRTIATPDLSGEVMQNNTFTDNSVQPRRGRPPGSRNRPKET